MLLNNTEITSNIAPTRYLEMSRDGTWILAVPQSTGASTSFTGYRKTAGGTFDGTPVTINIPVSNTSIDSLAISPDSNKLAVAVDLKFVYLYNRVNDVWTYDKSIATPARPIAVRFAQDNVDLLVSCNTGVVYIYDSVTSAQLSTLSMSAQHTITSATTAASTNIFILSPGSTNGTTYGVSILTKSGGTYTRFQITNTTISIYGIRISANGLKVFISSNQGIFVLRRASVNQNFNPNIYYAKSTAITRDLFPYKDRYLVASNLSIFHAFDANIANKFLESSALYETPFDGVTTNASLQLMSYSATDTYVAYASNITPRVFSISERKITESVYKNGNTFSGYNTANYQFALSPDKTKFFTMLAAKYNNSPQYNFGDVKNGQFLTNNLLSFNKTLTVSPTAGSRSSFSYDNNYFAMVSGNVTRIFYLNADKIYDEVDITPVPSQSMINSQFSPNNQYLVCFSKTILTAYKLNGGEAATLVTINLNGTTLAAMSDIIWYSNTEFMISSQSAGMYFFRYNPTTLAFDLVRTLTDSSYANTSMTMSNDKRFIYAIKNAAVGGFWGAIYTVTDFDNISYTGAITDNYSASDGAIKFIRLSPDGTKLVVTGPSLPYLGLYNVDTTSGAVSARIVLNSGSIAVNQLAYGIDWLTNDTFAATYNVNYYSGFSTRIYRFDSATSLLTDDQTLLINITTFNQATFAAISRDAKHIYFSTPSTTNNNSVGITRFSKNAANRYVNVGRLDTVSSSGVIILAEGKYMIAANGLNGSTANTFNARIYSLNAQGVFETFTEFQIPGGINVNYFQKIDDNNFVVLTSASNGGYLHYHVSNTGVVTRKADIARVNASTQFYCVGTAMNGQYLYCSDTTTSLRIFEKDVDGNYVLKSSPTVFNSNIFRVYQNPVDPSIVLLKASTSLFYAEVNADGTLNVPSTTAIQASMGTANWYRDGSGFFATGINPTGGGQTFNYLFDRSSKKYFRRPLDDYPTGSIGGTLIYADQGLDTSDPAKDVTVYIQSVPTSISTSNLTEGARTIGIQIVESEKTITASIINTLNPITSTGVSETDLAVSGNTLISNFVTTSVIDNPIIGNGGIYLNSIETSGFFGEKASYDIDLSLTTAITRVIPNNWGTLSTTPLAQPYAYGSTLINPIVTTGLVGVLPEIRDGDAVINNIETSVLIAEEGRIETDTVIESISSDGLVFSTPFFYGDGLINSIEMESYVNNGTTGNIEIVLNDFISDGELSQENSALITTTLSPIETSGEIEVETSAWLELLINSIENEIIGRVDQTARLNVVIDSIITEMNADVISNSVEGDTTIDSLVSDGWATVAANADLDIRLNRIVSEAAARVSGNIMQSNTLIPRVLSEGVITKTNEIDGAIRLNRILVTGATEVQMVARVNVSLNRIVTEAIVKRVLKRRFLNII